MPPIKRATLAKIRKATDVPTEEIAIPEWGGTVLVRGLTARQQFAMIESDQDFNTLLLCACVVEPALSFEDASGILDGPIKVVNQLLAAIGRVNGETETAVDDATRTFPAGAPE